MTTDQRTLWRQTCRVPPGAITEPRAAIERRHRRAPFVSRRWLLEVAATALAMGATRPHLARAAQEGEGTPAPTSNGAWSFTDDAGLTVELPARPQRIVADLNAAAPLWDFGIRPIAVAGWTTNTDAAWGNVNRETPVITAGLETSEPSAEELLALGADLFVTIYWGNDEHPYEWSFPDPAAYERISQIVPVVAISGTGSADANTERFAELAGLLGADLESPELVAAKNTYENAANAFKALAAEQAGITTLFVHADGEFEYVANPEAWADLTMYRGFGLNIMEPDVAAAEYWQELSPEQTMTYQSDVLFQSTRTGLFSQDELAAHPTYGRLPAVSAGQMGPRNQDFIQSYQGLTAALETMIDTLEDAQDVTP